ncbi:MAG: phytoene desaturase [Cyclobacteriaceae bacterium]|nr:phytoene desaturase [Cyclobacteriaceae bacterium HetDA_MAG_MS6]
MPKRVCVIGAGFSGLSAACHLSRLGYDVTILEKHSGPGGRARHLALDGFQYDMGPSWYWMPDVFERFFGTFGKKPSDYYQLIRLDPSYAVKFKDDLIDIPASMVELEALFESIEPGSAKNLQKFLAQAAYKYKVGINDLVYKPSRSLLEFVDMRLLYGLLKMDVFTSMRKHIRKFFKNEKLIELIEFPVLFLGATPGNTPALYSLMNYSDMVLGTWYPEGGMYQVAKGMADLASSLGVNIQYDQEVQNFEFDRKSIHQINTNNGQFEADVVVASADYHFVDQELLPKEFQNYTESYWDRRTMAPSSLLFYLGVDKILPNFRHHTLFFDEDFDVHAEEIYQNPKWPSKPLLYTSATSKTDKTVAPDGKENLVILIPVAPDLDDPEDVREKYFQLAMDRLEPFAGVEFRNDVIVKKSYAHSDFKNDYNSFRGNAYGLANTLLQTAILKPSLKNRKLKNLYFTGQLTVPGPGVPPSLISGEVVAKEIAKDFR